MCNEYNTTSKTQIEGGCSHFPHNFRKILIVVKWSCSPLWGGELIKPWMKSCECRKGFRFEGLVYVVYMREMHCFSLVRTSKMAIESLK